MTENENDEKLRSPALQPDWRDYVALSIAALQTTLLPIILLMIVMFAFALIISRLASL